MIRNALESIGGAGTLQSFVLVLFILFFLGACVFALRARKSYVAHMSALPLADDTPAPAPENEA